MSRKGVPNKVNMYDTIVTPRLSEIQEWIGNGETVQEICQKLSISHDTWYRYVKEHPVLSDLQSMGRSLLKENVEKSLFRLCTGYEYEELKTIVEEDKNGKKRTKLEKVKRHQPPSAQAISFFLRNRCPDEWSDKKELILDTAQNEQARKRLFLQMLPGEEVVEAIEATDEPTAIEDKAEDSVDSFEPAYK